MKVASVFQLRHAFMQMHPPPLICHFFFHPPRVYVQCTGTMSKVIKFSVLLTCVCPDIKTEEGLSHSPGQTTLLGYSNFSGASASQSLYGYSHAHGESEPTSPRGCLLWLKNDFPTSI